VALSVIHLASLYRVQDQYAKAEPLYQRSLRIFESKLGKDGPHVAACLNGLALLYQDQGQYAEAEPLYQRCLKIRECKLGKNHPDVARSLNNLASLYQVQGQYAKAESLYQRGLKVFESRLGKDHPHVARSLNNLAALYGLMQRWQDAALSFDRVRRGQREHVSRILPALAPQEQLFFLHEKVNAFLSGSLSLALLQPREAGMAGRSASWLVNAKALTQ
jgi:tetratricopeptide (TPR) repeat protein